MREGRIRKALTAMLVVPLLCAALTLPAPAQKRASKGRRAAPAPQTNAAAAQLYAQGFFAYENFDTGDTAPNNFRQVISRYAHTPEAEAAQFFLGSFYLRKYQLKAQAKGVGDTDTLEEARKAYEEYLEKYPQGGSCQCLSDTYFNLAMVYFQLGNPAMARVQLENIKSSYPNDRLVYIYQVISSPNQKDIIDSHFDALSLAEYTSSITVVPFNTAASLLKKWCRNEKNK